MLGAGWSCRQVSGHTSPLDTVLSLSIRWRWPSPGAGGGGSTLHHRETPQERECQGMKSRSGDVVQHHHPVQISGCGAMRGNDRAENAAG